MEGERERETDRETVSERRVRDPGGGAEGGPPRGAASLGGQRVGGSEGGAAGLSSQAAEGDDGGGEDGDEFETGAGLREQPDQEGGQVLGPRDVWNVGSGRPGTLQ